MLEYLRNAMNTILEKSTGCVKIIYKKLNKEPDTQPNSDDATVNVSHSWITLNSGVGGGNYTTNGAAGAAIGVNGNWNTYTTGTTFTYTNPFTYTNVLSGSLNLDKDADIKIGDRSLKEFMDTVSDRLAILQPDPAKLEKFAALKAAYEHYKMLEQLIGDAEPGTDEK